MRLDLAGWSYKLRSARMVKCAQQGRNESKRAQIKSQRVEEWFIRVSFMCQVVEDAFLKSGFSSFLLQVDTNVNIGSRERHLK